MVHTPHRMVDMASPPPYYTPMLFADSTAGNAGAATSSAASAPVRNKPVESDRSVHERFLKLKSRINLFRRTDWIMSEPEFVGLAKRTLVFRQLQGSCESIGAIYRSSEPIHFVVFVNGLGGKSSDFFWAKRWMKLLIGAPKHILIWSEANEQEQTFDEISVCGLRLAVEVASYLDNIGTTNFKLSFIGFSLGCVLVRAALTCAQMRPYIRNLHTFFSVNGPHLGVVYVKSRFLRFQISILSKIHMKGSVKELTFQDSSDLRRCYLYILSQAPGLEYFKNVLLVGSSQDKLVPVHSSNIQHCPASLVDNTVVGKTYDEMIKNLLGPLLKRDDVNLRRFDVFYDTGRLRYLESVFLSLSHVCALMSRNLFEKFMLLSAAECFK
ncbi:protein FAM135B-like [Rhipicephalus sanguineus]|uniref:protein FAM135B-like n=1 Tax=Rhipicephalus sanguineus TaxID=34632 RepID=UPI001894630E|nr:protein FAM135B-like [Rhipicephalus sanguineus]